MIAVIDYGAGNIRNVVSAVTRLGYEVRLTGDADEIRAAGAVIFPGVGAAGDTVSSLKTLDLVEPVRAAIAEGMPFLGICMGLQVLFTFTEEDGGQECLDIFPGRVRKFPDGLKIPHMGWNQVKQTSDHPVFYGIPDGENFYFVHSYYVEPEDTIMVAGTTEYGIEFCSAIIRDNLIATQFHPEKSGDMGLKLLDNFLRNAGKS